MKPVIGVVPLWDDDKQSVWMLPAYLDILQDNGAIPVVFPLNADLEDYLTLCEKCQGFLFTGGHDVDPTLYREDPLPQCGIICKARDNLERLIFDYAYEQDIPLFGICRGIQIINVLCGGSLYQDLPEQHPSGTDHHMHPPYDRVCHNVELTPGQPLEKLLRQSILGVNSYHHQAVKQLGTNLEIMAKSEDGLVEGVYIPAKKYIRAVQWHPEYHYRKDPLESLIVNDFVNHCR